MQEVATGGLTGAEVVARRAQGLGNTQWTLVLGAFAVWFVVMRQTWHWRLIERFVGA